MINQRKLLHYSTSDPFGTRSKLVEDARNRGVQTAFLAHSYRDWKLANGVRAYLLSRGWNVYIDWQDSFMPQSPKKITADKLKKQIKQLGWFLYLATANSAESRWCTWEIGYADGVKNNEQIIIIPTMDGPKKYGSEYLNLYQRIDHGPQGEGVGLIGIDNRFIPLHSIHY